MTLREQLREDARKFSEMHNISLARLATIVVNNSKFFQRLDAGGSCTLPILERFQEVFTDPEAWRAAKEVDRQRRRS